MLRRALSLLTLLTLGWSWSAATPVKTYIPGIRHEYQRFNNCGPVTVTMALSRWGSALNQYDSAPRLKNGPGDANVSPHELADYARAQGMSVHQGVAGNRFLLKRLLAAGLPVIVETWFLTADSGGMGHYRLLTGYDDAAGHFSALDSYLGPLKLPYDRFDELWRAYNRTYLVVVTPEKRPVLEQALLFHARPDVTKRAALRHALSDTERRGDAWAWWNLGHAKLALGDARGAARAFDAAYAAKPDLSQDPTRPARVSGGVPWRAGWYSFGPLEAYTRTGRFADVLRLTGEILRDVPAHEEALYWRGRALAGLGRAAEAQAAYRAALGLRPGYAAARQALGE
ncbi:Tetratricopeptide repeat-containing protein [Deinococcus reticulitermitis]|uniref:Tetratricopeptide repeat-containing protein n=1 Tax=Deinococcus reticulitermitis TaxID=856736 RepID=A0A1H7AA33_9DEIO|nr:C39 family peptidase [Deinococcus reticulitermitis]SEJ62523.1 Tetratricopeptide repeat-containing protein [Deinococcus reticulitermitis]